MTAGSTRTRDAHVEPAPTGVGWPLVVALARIPVLALAFAAVTGLQVLLGTAPTWEQGWQRAADHAYVVLNVVVDPACLLLLALALRREGRRLRGLVEPGLGCGPWSSSPS